MFLQSGDCADGSPLKLELELGKSREEGTLAMGLITVLVGAAVTSSVGPGDVIVDWSDRVVVFDPFPLSGTPAPCRVLAAFFFFFPPTAPPTAAAMITTRATTAIIIIPFLVR